MRSIRALGVAATIGAISGLVLPVRVAHADDPGVDANRQSAALALFQEGRRLVEAERYAEACPKFADSLRLEAGVGTMLNLAFCYERIGKMASAWSAYLDAAAAARDKGEGDRERVARARAAALETTLTKVTIAVAPDTGSSVEVRLDGTLIPPTLWAVGTPVDAGPHDLRAIAPGRVPWSSVIQAEADRPLVVTIPALEPASVVAPTPPPIHEGPGASASPDWHRPAAVVAAGAGVAAIAVGAAFVVAANDRYAESTRASSCNANNHCTAAGAHDRDVAFAYSNVAAAAMAGGAVAAAGAALLWLTSPRPTPRSVRWTLLPTVGDRVWTFQVHGAW